MNDDLYIIYRYKGNQRQFYDVDEGWSLSKASFFDLEEAEDFIADEQEAKFTKI